MMTEQELHDEVETLRQQVDWLIATLQTLEQCYNEHQHEMPKEMTDYPDSECQSDPAPR